MRRRTFIAGLLVAAAAGRAQAQRTAKVYRIARIYPALPAAEAIKASKTQGSLTWVFFEELRRLERALKRFDSIHPDGALDAAYEQILLWRREVQLNPDPEMPAGIATALLTTGDHCLASPTRSA